MEGDEAHRMARRQGPSQRRWCVRQVVVGACPRLPARGDRVDTEQLTMAPYPRVRCVFADLDGTLVHFERHFAERGGRVASVDAVAKAAVFEWNGETRACRLLPTSTMGPGLMSERTITLITALRNAGVKFVYVTGARKSTLEERLPLMAPVDAAFAETGGRYALHGSPTCLDEAWTALQEPACGPLEAHEAPALERPGTLWDWARALTARGYTLDTRSYYFCFRLDLGKQTGALRGDEAALRAVIAEALPETIDVACNLGKWDFFPKTSGKGAAVRYYMREHGLEPADCAALFDDENDLSMAAEVAHCFALGTTHPAVAAALAANPGWVAAGGVGPVATEGVLEGLLGAAKPDCDG